MKYEVETGALFDLTHTLASAYLRDTRYPFEALPCIGDWIVSIGETLSKEEFEERETHVWIARSACVASTASILPPAIIGAHAEVRHCAYLRGNVLVGEGCVIGNSTEVKNSILFDGAQVPHFNYVGDSVLGYRAHFGAGVIASNVRADKANVVIHARGEDLPTTRRKVGAMVGDLAEIGCGAVLAPGAVVGQRSIVYPLSFVRGCVPSDAVYKADDCIIKRC